MAVSKLPHSTNFTVEQALHAALQDADKLDEVLIVGTYKDDDSLYVVSSRLNRAQALWLAEMAKLHALNQ